jgi:hypothetical protein
LIDEAEKRYWLDAGQIEVLPKILILDIKNQVEQIAVVKRCCGKFQLFN